MKTLEREQRIISLLETRGELSIKTLGDMLDISPSTLRKQLASMQSKGLVIRTYGGVMSVDRIPDESFDNKLRRNMVEKRLIAERARGIIREGQSIALGSGTTIYALCMLLDDLRQGVIYTNSMQAADYLAGCSGLEVHICGGIIRSRTGTLIGGEVSRFFEKYHVDIAFVGCDTIDADGVVYSDNLAVASAERAVLANAKQKYILCDASKFGRSSTARINTLSDCDGLITCNVPRTLAEDYRSLTSIIYA